MKCDFIAESEKANVIPRFLQSEKYEVSPKQFQNVITVFERNVFNSHIQIILCGFNDVRWSFDSIENAYELLLAIETFVEKVGVLPSFPVRTSSKLFDAVCKRETQTTKENLTEYYKPFLEAPDATLNYLRNLDLTERNESKLIGFDKKSMFLSACSSLEFGESDYIEIKEQTFDKSKKYVGLFDVKFKWKKSVNVPFFTKIFPTSGLIYSPLLNLFSEFADEIKITRGWIFPETKKTFEGFYKTISKAKKETSNSSEPSIKAANSAIKSLYTEFFGFLRKPENASNFARKFFRPDWRGLIISQAMANLLRNALEIQNSLGKKPFAIYRDCLIYAASDVSEFYGTCLFDENKFSHEFSLETEKVFDKTGKAKINLAEINRLGKGK